MTTKLKVERFVCGEEECDDWAAWIQTDDTEVIGARCKNHYSSEFIHERGVWYEVGSPDVPAAPGFEIEYIPVMV